MIKELKKREGRGFGVDTSSNHGTAGLKIAAIDFIRTNLNGSSETHCRIPFTLFPYDCLSFRHLRGATMEYLKAVMSRLDATEADISSLGVVPPYWKLYIHHLSFSIFFHFFLSFFYMHAFTSYREKMSNTYILLLRVQN